MIVFDIDLLYMQEDDMRSQIYYELEDIPKKIIKSIYYWVTVTHLKDIVSKLMIKVWVSSTIGIIMIIETSLWIVFRLLCTWIYFKIL